MKLGSVICVCVMEAVLLHLVRQINSFKAMQSTASMWSIILLGNLGWNLGHAPQEIYKITYPEIDFEDIFKATYTYSVLQKCVPWH